MKKLILATAVTAALSSSIACAQTAPAAPEAKKPDNEVSFNLGVASEYRYRGISQSRMDPALQGGVDYTHNPTGLYAGAWASSIKWLKDAGTIGGYNGKGNVEVDLYGGKKGDIGGGFTYDVGGLYYWYPNNNYDTLAKNANTFELYGKVGYGPAYLKYSHSLTNLFGYVDSKNSGYLDAGADFDLGKGYTLNLHAGHQWIQNNSAYNYTDYKLGVTKEFFGVSFNLAAIGTNADRALYVTPDGKFTGKKALVLTATKTF
ncbi:MAG: TorF family putative porin [Burkholderiaceae bacterium]|nr:TorF family putative porin [Burkholderiaceae bacterium]